MRKHRCDTRFHSPKVLVASELHARFGFSRLLAARPRYARTHPPAVIEADAGENVSIMQFMPAYEAKAVHTQLKRFRLLLPGLLHVFGPN
jgi:hypothetical protein